MHQLIATIRDNSPANCTGGRDTRTQKSLLDTHMYEHNKHNINQQPNEVLAKLERTQTTTSQDQD